MESNISETNFIPSVEVDAFIKKEQLIYNYQQNKFVQQVPNSDFLITNPNWNMDLDYLPRWTIVP